MLRNLYLAYGITWAIHAGYLYFLWKRNSRVKKEGDPN
jgi:hypothetical protein